MIFYLLLIFLDDALLLLAANILWRTVPISQLDFLCALSPRSWRFAALLCWDCSFAGPSHFRQHLHCGDGCTVLACLCLACPQRDRQLPWSGRCLRFMHWPLVAVLLSALPTGVHRTHAARA